MTDVPLRRRRKLAITAEVARSSLFYGRDRLLAARKHPRHAAHFAFADWKRSDTLFVLGSGGSIGDITEAEWSLIAQCDSIGFNNWMAHRFVPTYYALELPAMSVPDRARTIDNTQHNLAVAAPRYRGVPFLLAADESAPLDERYLPSALRNQAYRVPLQLVDGRDAPELEWALRVHRRLGHLRPASHCVRMLKKRASVFRHVYFGLLAGYRRIVLAGVDLNRSDYFFDADPGVYARAGYRLDHVHAQKTGPVHRTNDPREGVLTVSAILDVLDRVALQPAGVALRVLHGTTALHPRFAVLERSRW